MSCAFKDKISSVGELEVSSGGSLLVAGTAIPSGSSSYSAGGAFLQVLGSDLAQEATWNNVGDNRHGNLGDVIEEAHMRNRQLNAAWAMEQGAADNVIEKVTKEGKTYFVVNDYDKLRLIFGDLLMLIQKIKSEGDYQAGKDLVENYGVQVDQAIHAEVLERVEKLNIAPYGGFINPKLVPEMNEAGEITDIKVTYPDDFETQMLNYAKNYSFLPSKN